MTLRVLAAEAPMDLAAAEPLVRLEALRWPVGDRDDLVQEAMLAVWAEDVTDPHLVRLCARRRMVDAIRRWYGRAGHWGYTGEFSPVRRWVSLDAPVDDEGQTLADLLPSPVSVEAEALARAELHWVLAKAARMDVRDRDALLCGVRGESLLSVGERYGVTESRACQIRQRARAKVAA